MIPQTAKDIKNTWHRIQCNVAAQLPAHQASPLHNCFEVAQHGCELVVTAPRGYAEALNRTAAPRASIEAQRFDLADSVLFVDAEPKPDTGHLLEAAPTMDTAVGDFEYDETPSAPTPKPTPQLLRPGHPNYDPWRDVNGLMATVKAYQNEKRRTSGHEQVASAANDQSDSDTEEETNMKPKPKAEDKPTKPVGVSPRVLWTATLGELELQMTKATFNTWLKGTTGEYDPELGALLVYCRNDYAVDWLTERLTDTVSCTASFFAGREVTVAFVTEAKPERLMDVTARQIVGEVDEGEDTAVAHMVDDLSWPDPRKNFTMVPDHLFQEINPRADLKPSTKLLVQTVLYHTLGNLDKEMRPSEWWEGVSQGDLCHAIGITPKTLRSSLKEALAYKLIKRRTSERRHCYDYALRFTWEGGEWDEEACG